MTNVSTGTAGTTSPQRAFARRAVTGVAATAALAGLLVPAAQAAPAADAATATPTTPTAPAASPAEGKVAVHQAASTAKDEQRVRAYWTPKRIAALSTPLSKNPPLDAADGARWKGDGAVTTTVGRLFFTEQGEDVSCTATLVKSANHSTLATAAHCLNSTDLLGNNDEWQQNLMFVPGFRDGKAPLGSFVVHQAVVNSIWLENDQIHSRIYDAHDQGFAVVGRNEDGKTVEEAAGAVQGIAFDAPGNRPAYQFGYPRAALDDAREGLPEYTGRELAYCQGTPREYPGVKDTPEPKGQWGVPCVMGGGSSGGPRFSGFKTGTGLGTQVGVNTQAGYMDSSGAACEGGSDSKCLRHLVGTQFTTALTKPLYDKAQHLS
ncbi:trypsin-like serine peptidase [Streptomyces sp. NPDC057654]|uniref:trypsin-like serine peptidase n=1 Tax=Streptomyces sp. NPDC057654 TaxID=3346196 RepID=UPI00369334E8